MLAWCIMCCDMALASTNPPCDLFVKPLEDTLQVNRNFLPLVGHWGIDLWAERGDPVYSIHEGTISRNSYYVDYGNMVEVTHMNGITSRYGHLERIAPDMVMGVRIATGQIIGFVGSSGISTGPHLHFEIRQWGRPLDPMPYIGLAPCPPRSLRRVDVGKRWGLDKER